MEEDTHGIVGQAARTNINETIGIEIFEESIQNVGLIYNQTKEIIVKQDTLYLNMYEG